MTAAEFRQKTRIQTKNLHKQNIERACLSADRDDADPSKAGHSATD